MRLLLQFTLIFILFTAHVTSVISQIPTFAWAGGFGGASYDFPTQVVVDDSGNVFTSGHFFLTVDFDPGPDTFELSSNGGYDIFVMKENAAGELLWVVSVGGSGFDQSMGVYVDSIGNVYFAGIFWDSVDFDPGVGVANLNSAGNYDSYLCKLNHAGQFLWVKQFASAQGLHLRAFTGSDEHGLTLSGTFNSTTDFDPDTSSFFLNAAGGETFIVHLDLDGNFQWAKQIGAGPGGIEVNAIAYDDSGSICLTGHYMNTCDFNPDTAVYNLNTSSNQTGGFILKLDSLGIFQWAGSFIGPSSECDVHGISIGSNNEVYIGGSFKGGIDFDLDTWSNYFLSSLGTSDAFLAKYSANGQLDWVKKFGGSLADHLLAIQIDEHDNLYGCGDFSLTTNFNPWGAAVNYNAQNGKMFVTSLDAQGNFRWARQMGSLFGEAISMAVSTDLSIHITGWSSSTGNYSPDSTNYTLELDSSPDIFVTKWYQCVNSSDVYISACDGAYSPDSNEFWTQSGYYIDTVSNLAGCDSIIRVHLTIKNSTHSEIHINSCGPFESPSGKYIWNESGDYNDTLVGKNLCDSLVLIHLTIRESKFTVIHDTACGYYFWDISNENYTVSGTYTDTLQTIYGCDSIFTLNLEIETIDATIMQSGNILLANPVNEIGYQWLKCDGDEFLSISGANTDEYTPTAGHWYAVVITGEYCQDTSDCYYATGLGISDLAVQEWSIFPNPFNGMITFETAGVEGSQVIIMDVRGVMISRVTVRKDERNVYFDGNRLSSGLYFAALQGPDGQRQVVKMIKN